jgi:hypothetical protein
VFFVRKQKTHANKTKEKFFFFDFFLFLFKQENRNGSFENFPCSPRHLLRAFGAEASFLRVLEGSVRGLVVASAFGHPPVSMVLPSSMWFTARKDGP